MRDLLILDSHVDTPGYVVDEGYQLGEEHGYYEADIPTAEARARSEPSSLASTCSRRIFRRIGGSVARSNG